MFAIMDGRGVAAATFREEMASLPSLYGLWFFDETSGTTISDSSGNGRHATISGASYALNQAALDASSGAAMNITLDDLTAAIYTPPATVTAAAFTYVKLFKTRPSFSSPLGNANHRGMGTRASSAIGGNVLRALSSGGQAVFELRIGATTTTIPTTGWAPAVNTEYVVIVTWDGTVCKIYIDGVLRGTGLPAVGGSATIATTAGFCVAGAASSTRPADVMTHDETAVCTTVISDAKIAALQAARV